MKVRFLISAKQDMQTIKTYIAQENPQAAKRFIKKFRKSTDRLKEFPPYLLKPRPRNLFFPSF